jgi:hypothetical protein
LIGEAFQETQRTTLPLTSARGPTRHKTL